MNQPERDALLVELKTTQKLLFEQNTEDHKSMLTQLEKISGTVSGHDSAIAVLKDRQRPSKKAMGGYGAGVIGLIVALYKSFFG